MTENRLVSKLRAFLLAEDDERRAVERELHDGPQQQLVAVAVNLQVVTGLVESDPQAALRLLDDVRAGVAQALDELRALAQRIHPPLLDSHGLVASLRMAAAAAPIPTRIEGTVEGDVPIEVAVTVYRFCVAALAAAAGGEGRATIAVARGERLPRVRGCPERRAHRSRRARRPIRTGGGVRRRARADPGRERRAPAPHVMKRRPRPDTG